MPKNWNLTTVNDAIKFSYFKHPRHGILLNGEVNRLGGVSRINSISHLFWHYLIQNFTKLEEIFAVDIDGINPILFFTHNSINPNLFRYIEPETTIEDLFGQTTFNKHDNCSFCDSEKVIDFHLSYALTGENYGIYKIDNFTTRFTDEERFKEQNQVSSARGPLRILEELRYFSSFSDITKYYSLSGETETLMQGMLEIGNSPDSIDNLPAVINSLIDFKIDEDTYQISRIFWRDEQVAKELSHKFTRFCDRALLELSDCEIVEVDPLNQTFTSGGTIGGLLGLIEL